MIQKPITVPYFETAESSTNLHTPSSWY